MGRRPGDGTRTAEDLPHDDLRPDGSLGGIVLREDAVMRKSRQEVVAISLDARLGLFCFRLGIWLFCQCIELVDEIWLVPLGNRLLEFEE